ncbi:MAG TPA: PCP reductase family protein [Nitrospira sp.]|nr:PCP reductase family protein [Nitrospira sp.]
MHTEGIEERADESGASQWFIRSECKGCGLKVGVDVPEGQTHDLVDRLMWTDEALHRLNRLPPYVAALVQRDVEQDIRQRNSLVVTYDALLRPKIGERIGWEPEAERRLKRVPAPVRAMARIELERTAADRGLSCITVSLMEEVKAKYFGMSSSK